jgi:hypothetical protein
MRSCRVFEDEQNLSSAKPPTQIAQVLQCCTTPRDGKDPSGVSPIADVIERHFIEQAKDGIGPKESNNIPLLTLEIEG